MIASHTHVLRDDDDVLVFHEMFMKLDQPLVEAIDVNFRHGGCGNNNRFVFVVRMRIVARPRIGI